MQMGMARAEELGLMLDVVRKSGKPVYCHADGYSNQILLAATRGCSKLYVSPAGEVEAVGIAAQLVYMHKLLVEHLHISVDILQVGKFKGAEEPLTRDGPSDEARHRSRECLPIFARPGSPTSRKGVGLQRTRPRMDRTPPKKAKERGLVDEVGYADDALDALKKASGAVRDEVRFGRGSEDKQDDLGDVLRRARGRRRCGGAHRARSRDGEHLDEQRGRALRRKRRHHRDRSGTHAAENREGRRREGGRPEDRFTRRQCSRKRSSLAPADEGARQEANRGERGRDGGERRLLSRVDGERISRTR